MSLQHIQKNSPRLLPKPAKFEKNPPNGYRVIRKTKCGAGGAAGAGGAGGARSSPIHKQASLAGRLMNSNKAHHKHTCVHTQTHLNHEEAALLSITVEAIIHLLIPFIPLTSRKHQTNSKLEYLQLYTHLRTHLKNKKPNIRKQYKYWLQNTIT